MLLYRYKLNQIYRLNFILRRINLKNIVIYNFYCIPMRNDNGIDIDSMISTSNRHQFNVDFIIISHWNKYIYYTCGFFLLNCS